LATSSYGETLYWRLHGRGSYAYRYTDRDLERIAEALARENKPAYVMFNNFSSKADALRFQQLLSTAPEPVRNEA
jgi:uncharacterized protein YecE (DUF72 family)